MPFHIPTVTGVQWIEIDGNLYQHLPSTQPPIVISGAQVANTFELLEAILYELPMKEILFATRVSKQFQAVITNSSKLQHTLFLRPIPGGVMVEIDGREGVVAQNPLLYPILGRLLYRGKYGKAPYEQQLFETRSGAFPKSFSHPTASWRIMLPTQPPLHQCFSLEIQEGQLRSVFQLPSSAFRLGNIVTALDSLVQRHVRGRFQAHNVKVLGMLSIHIGRTVDNDQLQEMIQNRARKPAQTSDICVANTNEEEEQRIQEELEEETDGSKKMEER